MLHLQERI